MAHAGIFKMKEDQSSEIRIFKDQVLEIVPDADFRFSLVILKDGNKYFLCGTEKDIREALEGTE